jgi:hypothetical protein
MRVGLDLDSNKRRELKNEQLQVQHLPNFNELQLEK